MSFELKYTPNICPYCGCGCGLNIVTLNGKIKGVEGWKRHPVNEGKLCPKGNFSYQFVQSKDRLKHPLIKKNGKFIEISWDKAVDIIVSKLNEYRKENPNSIAFLASARCTNEENYILQKFARVAIGTNNIDHCARLCHAPSVAGLAQTFGSGAMTNSILDIEEAESIFIIGSNTAEQHPIIWRRVLKAKNKGAKLIVADPRKTPTASLADIHLPIKPGSNIALINAMMNVIIEEGLEDTDFIKKRTKGFEKLKKVIEKYKPEKVEKIVGVPAKKIREAAITYAKADRATILYAMGITQHTTGTHNVISTANLAMLTGNIGKKGTGVNPLRGQNNVQGACDMGALPEFYPGYQKVTDKNAIEKMQKIWKCDDLSSEPGLTVVEMMDAAIDGKVKCMYIMGENPVLSDPDIKHVKKALKNLEFLIVQDIFLTETAEFADIVLPTTAWGEKNGTYTSTERRVQCIRKAADGPGEAKDDWRIICEIAKRMNVNGFEFNSTKEIFNEIRKVTPQYAGMNFKRLQKPGGLQWPCPDESHPGTPILHTEKFATPDGLGKFIPVEHEEPAELPDDRYPFILTTGRILFHYHTGTMTRRSETLDNEVSTGFVEINDKDASKLGIKDGEIVKVMTRRGEIKIPAKVTSKVREGVLFIPFHFVECAANMLTSTNYDPISKIPEFKVSAANIEKLED